MRDFQAEKRKKMRFSRWQCSNQNLLFLMKPIPDSILMRLRIVANGVNKLKHPDNSFIV